MVKKRKLIAGSRPVKPATKPPTKPRAVADKKSESPVIPFAQEDRILLVGEGDFSFAKSIVEDHGCCDVTATCLDTRDEVVAKYQPQAEKHIEYLEEGGQKVFYAVDATKLDQNKQLQKSRQGGWDVTIFNFPHVGGKTKDVNRQVRFNQELIVKFFTAVQPLMSAQGTIVVTLFEGEPYTLWNIRDLARHAGLQVARSFRFQAKAYPGYSHARTLGNVEGGGGWKGEDRQARSFVFQRKEADTKNQPTKKRNRDADSSDDET